MDLGVAGREVFRVPETVPSVPGEQRLETQEWIWWVTTAVPPNGYLTGLLRHVMTRLA